MTPQTGLDPLKMTYAKFGMGFEWKSHYLSRNIAGPFDLQQPKETSNNMF